MPICFESDTVHGRWKADFAHDDDSVTIDGMRLPFIGTGTLPRCRWRVSMW